MTQQNSALVEQNAAAAKALEQQSEAMDKPVEFFTIDLGPKEPTSTASPGEARQPNKAAAKRENEAPRRSAAGGVRVAAAAAF